MVSYHSFYYWLFACMYGIFVALLWHLLVKKECPLDDPFIGTFREKLNYLVEIHCQRVEFLES